MMNMIFNLQRFADGGGALTNTTTQYVNSYTGAVTAFDAVNKLTPENKTFYDTALLENAKPEMVHNQFGKKQNLPRNNGKTVEWRKFNTLANAGQLTEGVIPTGQKLGVSAITDSIEQFGTYVSVSDILDLTAIDPVVMEAQVELSASAGRTQDELARNDLVAGTNVLYAQKTSGGALVDVTSRSGLDRTAVLTPDTVKRARTKLKKMNAPTINGKYVAIIHPSVAYDLTSSEDWVEYHKYAATTEIFDGEIGELDGVRFVESTQAKIWKDSTCPSDGTESGKLAVYATLFLGKDAYGTIDLQGGGLQMIIHNASEAGGPLDQFSTVGYKLTTNGAKILYEDRMVRVESCSAYSNDDVAN